MNALLIAPYYISWHYTKGLVGYVVLWGRSFWFVGTFFNIKQLSRTLFSPFKRIQEQQKRGFHPREFFETVIVNVLMRCVGVVVRSITILFCFLFYILALVVGAIGIIVWLALPWIIPLLFIVGLIALTR
jgi:hypothetical protein